MAIKGDFCGGVRGFGMKNKLALRDKISAKSVLWC
jgi:hypothetical protein